MAKNENIQQFEQKVELNENLRKLLLDLKDVDVQIKEINNNQKGISDKVEQYKVTAEQIDKDLQDRQDNVNNAIERIDAFLEVSDSALERLNNLETTIPSVARKTDVEAETKRIQRKISGLSEKITAYANAQQDFVSKTELESRIDDLESQIQERDKRIASLEKSIKQISKQLRAFESRIDDSANKAAVGSIAPELAQHNDVNDATDEKTPIGITETLAEETIIPESKMIQGIIEKATEKKRGIILDTLHSVDTILSQHGIN